MLWSCLFVGLIFYPWITQHKRSMSCVCNNPIVFMLGGLLKLVTDWIDTMILLFWSSICWHKNIWGATHPNSWLAMYVSQHCIHLHLTSLDGCQTWHARILSLLVIPYCINDSCWLPLIIRVIIYLQQGRNLSQVDVAKWRRCLQPNPRKQKRKEKKRRGTQGIKPPLFLCSLMEPNLICSSTYASRSPLQPSDGSCIIPTNSSPPLLAVYRLCTE